MTRFPDLIFGAIAALAVAVSLTAHSFPRPLQPDAIR